MQTARERINPNTDLVVTTELATCGTISYWRCAEGVDLGALTDRWAALNLDPKLLPKAPEPETALRRAVMEQQDRHRLVRAVSKAHEWAIVDETVEEGKAPVYRTLTIVRYENGRAAFTVIDSDWNTEQQPIENAVRSAFTRQSGLLASTDITTWLVRLAYKHGAVTLRDTGGVYFVPRQHVDFWRKVATAVEGTAGYKVFRIPAMRNSEAVAAIVDAITQEAEQLVAKMEEEMIAGLGARAMKTRQAEAEALLAKVGDYEKLLGMEIEARTRVEALQATIVAAAMTEETKA